MAWTITELGLKLWIKDDGSALVRDPGGKVYSTTRDKAERLVLNRGYSSATPEQRTAQVEEIRQGGVGGLAKGVAKSAVSGVTKALAGGLVASEAAKEAVGLPTVRDIGVAIGKPIARALGRSEEDIAQAAESAPSVAGATTGLAAQENMVRLLGGEQAAEEYGAATKAQLRQHPVATTLADVGGQVAGSLLIPGAGLAARGAGLTGKVALGAAEAAGQGAAQVSEDAYIKDQELTAEQVLAGAGLTGVLGGGVTLGFHGLGRVFRRSGSRGTTEFDAAVPGSKVAKDQAASDIAETALGESPTPETVSWLRRQFGKVVDKYEDTAGVVTGAAKEDMQALRLRKILEPGAESPFARFDKRDLIRAENTEELATVMQRVQDAEQRLFKQNIQENLKGNQLRRLLDTSEGALERQRAEVSGHVNTLDNALRDLESNPNAYGERSWFAPMRDEIDRLRQRVVDDKVEGADLFTSVDKLKRKLDGYVKRARRQAVKGSGDFAKDFQANNVAERLSAVAEPLRHSLMKDAVWGAEAAASQREINGAWVNHLGDVVAGVTDPNDTYLRAFFSRHPGTYEDAADTFRVDKTRVLGHLREMGNEASVTARDTENAMLRQLDSGTELAKQLDKHYSLGPELKKDLDSILKGNQEVRDILGRIGGEMKTFQQIDRLSGLQGQVAGMGVGAMSGGVLGGPVGAAAGAALGSANMPVRIARQAWALKALANNVQRRFRGTVSEVAQERAAAAEAIAPAGPPKTLQELKSRIYARRAKAAQEQAAEEEAGLGPWGAKPAAEPAEPGRGPAPSVFGPARLAPILAGETTKRVLGKDGRDNWRDQAEMVMQFSDPNAIGDRIGASLGTLASDMPTMAGMVSAKAAQGAQYLATTLGPMIPPRSPLQPQVPLRKLPADDQAKWNRIWAAVNDPMSVLRDWRTGRVKQDQLDALRANWPRMYADLQEHTAELIGQRKTPLGYDQRRQIAILLDLGGMLEPTLDPGFLARTDAWYQAQKQASKPPARVTAKAPSTSSLHDLHRRET